jgi:hypothetical protein
MAMIHAVRWLLLLLGALDLVALKAGWISHDPALLAVLVAAALIAFLVRVVQLARSLSSDRRRFRTLAAIVGSTGVVVGLLAGMANWLLSLQGFAILAEGDSVALHGGTALQEFDAGPLARIEEMGVHLLLDELELVPEGPEAFSPTSHLRVWRDDREPVRLGLSHGGGAAYDSLWFFQGAFGFAPRIVIEKAGDPVETVFDRVVPFTSLRRGPDGISFEGSFTVRSESLRVEGEIDLASLDEGMRGHATLGLELSRDGMSLGRGRLLPGHFAEVDQGFRVGFAGLERWSEIVISRRNYGRVVLAGTILAALGGILWLVATWRGR